MNGAGHMASMLDKAQTYWDFELHPSSGFLKTRKNVLETGSVFFSHVPGIEVSSFKRIEQSMCPPPI
jgi:hypothetical protein